MSNCEIDISELDPTARSVLSAALTHARQNRHTRTHEVPLDDFYRLADLGDEVYVRNFMGWVMEAMTAVVLSPADELEVLDGWPVFDKVRITKTCFEFEVKPMALDAIEFPSR